MISNNQFISYCIQDKIATVTVKNPPVNTLSKELMEEFDRTLNELLRVVEAGDLRAMILTADGEKAFIAGADINVFKNMNPKEGRDLTYSYQRVATAIARFPVPVIAALNGFALGGGCEIALACDIRLAVDSAFFGFPEVKLGILPGMGGTQRLPRTIGIGKAKELLFTGNHIPADEALRIGLIDRITHRDKLMEEAMNLAGIIASNGPVAVKNIKISVNEGLDTSLDKGLNLETDLIYQLFNTKDMKEGVNAFMEKRKPDFMGK